MIDYFSFLPHILPLRRTWTRSELQKITGVHRIDNSVVIIRFQRLGEWYVVASRHGVGWIEGYRPILLIWWVALPPIPPQYHAVVLGQIKVRNQTTSREWMSHTSQCTIASMEVGIAIRDRNRLSLSTFHCSTTAISRLGVSPTLYRLVRFGNSALRCDTGFRIVALAIWVYFELFQTIPGLILYYTIKTLSLSRIFLRCQAHDCYGGVPYWKRDDSESTWIVLLEGKRLKFEVLRTCRFKFKFLFLTSISAMTHSNCILVVYLCYKYTYYYTYDTPVDCLAQSLWCHDPPVTALSTRNSNTTVVVGSWQNPPKEKSKIEVHVCHT
jgi:hypothetical protein